jgi:hypothetical protein
LGLSIGNFGDESAEKLKCTVEEVREKCVQMQGSFLVLLKNTLRPVDRHPNALIQILDIIARRPTPRRIATQHNK